MIDPKFQVQHPCSLSERRNPASRPRQNAALPKATAATDQQIRAYAYGLYLDRGGVEGHAVEDWLLAESYLSARKNRANKVIG